MFKFFYLWKLTSRKLALISFLFWFASLWNVALVSYTGETLTGLPIVLLGFMAGNLAWFANPLLIFLLLLLITGSKSKKTIIILILIILLACNTVLLDTFYSASGGGGSSALFGYGTGFVLWLISIMLAFIAVGIQYQEFDEKGQNQIGLIVQYTGVLLLLAVIFGTFFLNIQDKKYANNQEKERLAAVVFKKGSVCSEEIRVNSIPLVGVLEVIHPMYKGFREPRNPAYMFNSPEKLLYWGIPLVKMRGMDYSLLQQPKETLLIATASKEESSFQLEISKYTTNDIRIVLKQKNEIILFDQTWKNLYKKSYQEEIFCPDLKINANENENPRKMIFEALQIKNVPVAREKKFHTTNVEARIYDEKAVELDTNKTTDEYLFANSFYDNCPDNVYAISGKEPTIDGQMFDRPVYIDGTYYFTRTNDFNMRGFRGYSCSKNYLYLYSDAHWGNSGNNTFDIQKRSIKDFTLISSMKIHYPKGTHLSNDATILSAYEENNNTFIELYDRHYKKLITISTPN